MSTTNATDLHESAAAAVTEAARIAAQAARRGTETTRASIDVARSILDESAEFGRRIQGAWVAEGETALRAAFATQNSALEAGLSLFDLGVRTTRQAAEQLSELVHRSQESALETWQASVKATERVSTGSGADSAKR